jgi:SAM-dependent methyltransferase
MMPRKRIVPFSMAKLRNVADRTFGEYGEAGYRNVVTEDAYEERRFESSRSGRRKLRHELAIVTDFLARLPPDRLILDAPCGMGRFTGPIRAAGHRPVCLDLNVGMLQRAQQRHGRATALLQGDVLSLPFADGTFDAAICFRLLHHLPDNLVLGVLRELRRITRTALVTFYDTRCLKYQRKRLLAKRVSGQYYPASHMLALCREAGWTHAQHVNPFAIHRNLHALHLAS